MQGGLLLFTSWQLQLCARRNFPSSLSISWSDKFLCKNVECDWQPQEPELRDRDYIMADLNRWTSTSPLLFRHFYPIPLSADTSRSFGQRQSSHCLDHQGVQNVCHSVRGCIQMFPHGRSNDEQGLPFSNGFAFRHSDLDISLTFRDIPTRLQSHSFI